MTTAEKRTHCRGCRDNFYNGNNPHGISECWMLKSARLVTRYEIGYWTPMDTARNLREVRVFNCFNQKGSVYLTDIPSHLKNEWERLKREAKKRPREAAIAKAEGR